MLQRHIMTYLAVYHLRRLTQLSMQFNAFDTK